MFTIQLLALFIALQPSVMRVVKKFTKKTTVMTKVDPLVEEALDGLKENRKQSVC